MIQSLIKKLNKDNLEIIKGSIITLIGSGGSKLIILISGVILANILSAVGYGKLGIVRSSINMFIVVATSGLGLTSTKYISQYIGINNELVSKYIKVIRYFSFVLASIITVALFISADFISVRFLDSADMGAYLRLGAILLFFSSINAVQLGTLIGFKDFKGAVKSSLIESIVELILVTLCAKYFGIGGAIVAIGISYLVFYLVNRAYINKHFKKNELDENVKVKLEDFEILWKFALPAALSSFMVVPVLWYIKTLLVRHDGFAEAALFDIAEQWRILILFIPLNVGKVILPFLSKYEQTNERDRQQKVVNRMIIINILLTTSIAVVIYFIAPLVLDIYGDNYTDTSTIIVAAFSTVFCSVANIIGQSIAAKSAMWVGFSFNLLWAILLVYFTVLFLELDYKATALALALLVTYGIHALLQYLYVIYRNKRLKITNE